MYCKLNIDLWLHAAVTSENKLNLPLQCQCISFGTVITLKDAYEVNRQYYAGIRSYAACIILCPKLCWHNTPRPSWAA